MIYIITHRTATQRHTLQGIYPSWHQAMQHALALYGLGYVSVKPKKP